MTIYSDTLHWWDITPIFDPLLIWTLLPNLTFYLIVWGFHRTFATGAACQQRTLTPPDTLSCPTLGIACVLMSKPISPELVLFPDFWVSNIPRYFCFALSTCQLLAHINCALPFGVVSYRRSYLNLCFLQSLQILIHFMKPRTNAVLLSMQTHPWQIMIWDHGKDYFFSKHLKRATYDCSTNSLCQFIKRSVVLSDYS